MGLKRGLVGRLNPAKAADRERDKGNWSAAAALYAGLLAKTGRNAATFRYIVQLGNCLKEAGRYDEALAAYEDATRIKSRDADLHVQCGHLHKLMGNMPASAWAYQHAYNLDPGNQDARWEIESGGAHAKSGVELPEDRAALHTIWFDVTDFIDYARHNVSLSGIQRVCGNLMLGAVDMRLPGYRIVPVIPDYDNGQFFSVRYDNFVKLVRLFHEPQVNRDDVLSGVTEIVATKTAVTPSAGDIFIIAGAFWIISRYDKVAELRRQGMKFGLFIHDLIQIRNPDYVMPDAVKQFKVQLSDVTELCDFILTNSRYVEDDVQTYLRETKQRDLPVTAVPLPTEFPSWQARRSPVQQDDPRLRFVLSREYVLAVSTIEVRKNHALLIRVWEQLREELGEKTPYLVLVGKWGWRVEALRAHVENRGYKDDWLFILDEVADGALECLYKKALFTIYPSFAEGFGLPIGESLTLGKPCIASSTTAMPEVGGSFVRYFNPFDWEAALPVIRQPIVDREDLLKWQENVAAGFRPRRWNDFCDEFFRSLVACAQAAPNHAVMSLPLLPSRRLILGGDADILAAAAERRPIITFRAARARNWHSCGESGVWSSDRHSEIAFRSDLAEGENVDLFIRLYCSCSGDDDSDLLVIADCGAGPSSIKANAHPTFYHFIGTVGTQGKIQICLLARGKPFMLDGRKVYLGWSGLAYCRHGSGEDLDLIMAQLLPTAEPLRCRRSAQNFQEKDRPPQIAGAIARIGVERQS